MAIKTECFYLHLLCKQMDTIQHSWCAWPLQGYPSELCLRHYILNMESQDHGAKWCQVHHDICIIRISLAFNDCTINVCAIVYSSMTHSLCLFLKIMIDWQPLTQSNFCEWHTSHVSETVDGVSLQGSRWWLVFEAHDKVVIGETQTFSQSHAWIWREWY